MRFLIDACAGIRLAQWLRTENHDVVESRERGPGPFAMGRRRESNPGNTRQRLWQVSVRRRYASLRSCTFAGRPRIPTNCFDGTSAAPPQCGFAQPSCRYGSRRPHPSLTNTSWMRCISGRIFPQLFHKVFWAPRKAQIIVADKRK